MRPCGATLQGSQVCSALRGLRPLGLAFGHPCTSLGRSTVVRLLAFRFGTKCSSFYGLGAEA
nr:hypothetical protein [Saprospira grandis]